MREILFKGKRKEDNEWIYGHFMQMYFTKNHTSISTADGIFQVDPETVSEYTGKRDSNGRKIFENDIVRVHSHCLNESYIAVVKFGEYGDGFHSDKGNIGFYIEFYCDKNGIFRQDFGYWLEACKVEVIGNIFDK